MKISFSPRVQRVFTLCSLVSIPRNSLFKFFSWHLIGNFWLLVLFEKNPNDPQFELDLFLRHHIIAKFPCRRKSNLSVELFPTPLLNNGEAHVTRLEKKAATHLGIDIAGSTSVDASAALYDYVAPPLSRKYL